MPILEPPLLWTRLEDRPEGVALLVRGELSSLTAPALDSLLTSLLDTREHVVLLDLRAAELLPPAAGRMLERWDAVPGTVEGTFTLPVAN